MDFKKLLKESSSTKPIDPIEIWEKLDKKVGKEYLKPTQKPILEEWNSKRRCEKDNIIKLHTGHGKTIVGLVILQSCLNEGKGPALYICPNNYLVSQTLDQAKEFGINAIEFPAGDNFPPDFLNSKAILVINCKKMFNGKSLFGVVGSKREIVEVGALVMDDAHSCLEIMRESFSIRIQRKNEDGSENKLWTNLFSLFSESLKKQGLGTFSDLYQGIDVIQVVPFWSWSDKINEVIEILSKEKDNQLKFEWNLIKDVLKDCICVFSGDSLEISPRILPIQYIPSFANAKRRFFLSATLTEDAFLIKDLNLEPDSVRYPLTTDIEKYSGERLFIIPSLIHSDIKRQAVIEWLSTIVKKKINYGVVAIVPSFHHAEEWKKFGSKITDINNLYKEINELKNKIRGKDVDYVLTLVNKYDGVDLPDETCRILCIDSLPQYMSLSDRYFQKVRTESKIRQQLLAQRIEQGVGRGVRGRNDWCIIVIVGSDLANFLSSDSRLALLSNETKEQIKIGADLANRIKGEGALFNVIGDLTKQCLDRDVDWKEYYRQKMKDIEIKKPNENYIEQYVIEKEAEDLFSRGLYTKAIEKVRFLIDKSADESDKGWYLQLLASYQYMVNKAESMSTQLKAHVENKWLSIPESGITYTKMSSGAEPRTSRITGWIKDHHNHNEIIVEVESILEKLCFGGSSDVFEQGINELGIVLGFATQQPEKNFGEGPDNLWNDGESYFIIECKNEVKKERDKIYKEEVGQLNNSIGWFKNQYPASRGIPILIHPSNNLGKGAFINSEEGRVLTPENLELLKTSILGFFKSLSNISFEMLDETKISKELQNSKLATSHIYEHYCSKPKKDTI